MKRCRVRLLSAGLSALLWSRGHTRHQEARSCATLEIQVAHEGSGYMECACGVGVELDRTRHGVVCGIEHLVNSCNLNLVENNRTCRACELPCF